ncbi:cobalamin synthase related protein [Thermoplasma acidophilum]|uniref:Adenosylcobinamide-GDP ribazoletransferase n=1 Tax=Thermoplasma acidophilum (strain ATCC 25905 / DSM 1728 / JCM 9062 / NBRC 15155 / AMRC-C165) TaxID=273075 RepID=COBS_THEAC|nr:adenosylcobinamide-GDP ribazoletransferase [Thermoplasma acidophilum]Q9HJ91.1 RecName: Full=Adenosylcobinamide-GDP ribazoletransferase; AltName: Full=Cobalamin synthase; AltName: Full=Cobalamin-5'-phosphate synthase [Thermoplasma acidophilum DSM 1728]MCY0851812.1 adenosylcobinamide-GDP ribazoletransferase [Thermoplasma acidophilum]CAC12207.1 cobalamin synthase related protein [Thermoplasma acidophilum]
MKGLRSAFSFFTIIPIKSELDEHLIAYVPLVALFDAALAASLYVAIYGISKLLASFISVSAIYIVNGLNHVDAVADAGDAMMIRNRSRIREVFEDHDVGAGGVFTLIFVYLLALISLSSMDLYIGIFSIILAEFLSKSMMMITLHRSRPLFQGIGSLFIDLYRKHDSLYTVEFVVIPIVLALLSRASIMISVALAFLIFIIVKMAVIRRFGGINGDLAGFIGELGRSIFLMISLIMAQSSVLSTYDILSKIMSSL